MSEAHSNSPPPSETKKILDITQEDMNNCVKVEKMEEEEVLIVAEMPAQDEESSDTKREEDKVLSSENVDPAVEEGKKETNQEVHEDKNSENNKSEKTEEDTEDNAVKASQTTVTEKPTVSVGTSTIPVAETPEVSSTKNDEPPKNVRSSRRPSYNSGGGRSYGASYQNYGLTHLPYKSNFEPSENARRKAEEFFKTIHQDVLKPRV